METEPPALRIRLEMPNTINLEENLWESQPQHRWLHNMTIYAPLIIIAAWVSLFMLFNGARDSGCILWVLVLILGIASIFFLHHETSKLHEKKHLSYRKSKIDALIQLLKSEGYSMTEDSQNTLMSISQRSDFKVLTDNGIKYRCEYLEITGDKIDADLILTDYSVLDKIKRAEWEAKKTARIEFLTRSYEARNGEFLTPELRAAFIEGLKLGSR